MEDHEIRPLGPRGCLLWLVLAICGATLVTCGIIGVYHIITRT